LIIGRIAAAERMLPSRMPVEIVMPINPPTCALASPSTVWGAFTAHRVLT